MSAPRQLMKDWVVLVTSLPTIFDEQDNPTAPRPSVEAAEPSYAALDFLDDETAGSTLHERTTETATGANVEQLRSGVQIGTLAVEFYGPGAVDYARALGMSTGRPDVLRLLEAAGDFAINNPSQVTDDPILRSGTREPAASISFEVQWIETETYATEYVATVKTTATVTADDGS